MSEGHISVAGNVRHLVQCAGSYGSSRGRWTPQQDILVNICGDTVQRADTSALALTSCLLLLQKPDLEVPQNIRNCGNCDSITSPEVSSF